MNAICVQYEIAILYQVQLIDKVCSHYHVLVICKWCSLMILLVTLNVVIHTLVIVDRLERWFDRD